MDAYKELATRLDAMPQGYPATDDGVELELLAYLFEENYLFLGIAAGACAILAGVIYRYRESLYLWAERLNSNGR